MHLKGRSSKAVLYVLNQEATGKKEYQGNATAMAGAKAAMVETGMVAETGVVLIQVLRAGEGEANIAAATGHPKKEASEEMAAQETEAPDLEEIKRKATFPKREILSVRVGNKIININNSLTIQSYLLL